MKKPTDSSQNIKNFLHILSPSSQYQKYEAAPTFTGPSIR